MAAPNIPRHPPGERPWSNLNLMFSYEPELLEAWVENAEQNGIPLNAFQADVNKLHESGEWSPFRHAKFMWKADAVAAKEAAELAEKRRREEQAKAEAEEIRKKEEERIRAEEARAAELAEKRRREEEEQAKAGEDRKRKAERTRAEKSRREQAKANAEAEEARKREAEKTRAEQAAKKPRAKEDKKSMPERIRAEKARREEQDKGKAEAARKLAAKARTEKARIEKEAPIEQATKKARAEEKTRAEQRVKAEERARTEEDPAREERRQNKVENRSRRAGRSPSRMTVPQVRWPEQDLLLVDLTSPTAESSKAAEYRLKDHDPVSVEAESLAAEFSKSNIAASAPASISSFLSKNKGKQDAESLFIPEEPLANYTAPSKLPPWYTKIKPTDRGIKELGKRPAPSQTQALKALSSMKGCIDRCKDSRLSVEERMHLFEELRNQVHKAEITLKVDRFIIRKAKMLDTEYGLPQIFDSEKVEYPWDLKMDAWQLYSRWRDEIFEIDLLRGIKIAKGMDRGGDSIEPSWRGRFSAKYYGQGNLVLGQWWPTQLCTVRDGAHGSAQGGIYGEKHNGAYSIVLSNGSGYGYDDEDEGDRLWYSGTEGKDCTPTENTLRLIETFKEVRNQVRVIRSHQLPRQNPYRPAAGLRYDGLYELVDMKLVNREKAAYKFRLVRCKGQFPIRYKKDEKDTTSRPTKWEVQEALKLKKEGR